MSEIEPAERKSDIFTNNLDDLVASCLVELFRSNSVQPADNRLIQEFIDHNGLPQFIEEVIKQIKLEASPERLFIAIRLLEKSIFQKLSETVAASDSTVLDTGESLPADTVSSLNPNIRLVARLFNTATIRLKILSLEHQPEYFSSLELFVASISDIVWKANFLRQQYPAFEPYSTTKMILPDLLHNLISYEKLSEIVAIFSRLSDQQKKRAMGILQKTIDHFHVYSTVQMILEYLGEQEYELFDRRLRNTYGVVKEPADIMNKRFYLDEPEVSDDGEPQLLSRGKLQLQKNPDGEEIIVETKEYFQPHARSVKYDVH